ncbi:DUF1365 domain-containing protein [Nocardia yunnanensis]|uniref:DUF1365 domain-containing protein n=1 Tax=Nocardia yunnanensis TaxID=2382165 RepID=A0A386ZDC6_9NOCA|nr:DUF1365 domain-containing protein [Nocardia yunnanensis]AYF75862.1 DUF1365 domain-containing protein [Nocardia yunnanensis]
MTIAPALYLTRLRHIRRAPVHHEFEYRGYSWYFDLDAPPRPPLPLRPFGYFRAVDHLEGPGTDLRARVDRVLAEHGIDRADGPVTALMGARALGYAFDPLTVFWCHDRGGRLRCAIAEVHNTYGGRHAYVLFPDAHGRAETEKRFYVSPFNAVDGRYRLRIPEPGDELALHITLRTDDLPPFYASMTGHRLPVTTATVLRAHLRAPLSPWLTAARIRRHGIALWAKGVPVVPRPSAPAPRRISL